MNLPTRGKRLVRRYPVLESVPEDDRPAIVRASLRNPLVLVLVFGVGLLGLPVYFDFAFAFLRVDQETDMLLKMAKFAGAVLLPICIAVPLLSRFVIPQFIKREMRKRGYTTDAPK